MTLLKMLSTFILLSLFLINNLFASLYDDNCEKKPSGRLCRVEVASLEQTVEEIEEARDLNIIGAGDGKKAFETRLKNEKLLMLAENNNKLLSYFWNRDQIISERFECENTGITNEHLFDNEASERRVDLSDNKGESEKAIKRKRALAIELIKFQRILNEIEKEENKIRSNRRSYTYHQEVEHKSGATHESLTDEASENLQRLSLARFAILNNYPILSSKSWQNNISSPIFNKSSDSEASFTDTNYVIQKMVDPALSEIQNNIIKEAKATCNQSVDSLISNDFIAEMAINGNRGFVKIYCAEYDRAKRTETFKTAGSVTLAALAVAAAPFSGFASLLSLGATGVGFGASVIDAGMAVSSWDNYFDLKRAFLTQIDTHDVPAFTTYEEVQGARTEAMVSSILAGAGGVGEGVGIAKISKMAKSAKSLAAKGLIGKKNVSIAFRSKSKIVELTGNLKSRIDVGDATIDVNNNLVNSKWGDTLIDSKGKKWRVKLNTELSGKRTIIIEDEYGQKLRKTYGAPVISDIYDITIRRVDLGNHRIKLVVPSGADTKVVWKIQDAIANLPENHIDSLNEIYIQPKPYFRDTNSGKYSTTRATAKGDYINFYPAGMSSISKTTKHEFGHTVANKIFGSSRPDAEWETAMKLDGRSVSDYADTNTSEDFAETVLEYLETGGGRLARSSRRDFANRFKILDEIFEANPSILEEVRYMAALQYGDYIKTAGGGIVIGYGTGIYIQTTND